MTIGIRPAGSDDAEAIRQVHLSAFPTALEADLVERLASDGDLIVSLVAERDRDVIGHVALSRMEVSAVNVCYRALGLGPVGVHRRMHGSGVGTALIEAAVGIAGATGEDLIFLLGEPDYYRRFGFTAAIAQAFASPYSGPYFMALALKPDFRPPNRGQAEYASAFGAFVSAP